MSTNTTPELKYFLHDMKDIYPDWNPENNDVMMTAVKQAGQLQKARAKAIVTKECEVYAKLWDECAKQAWVPVVGCNQQLNDRWNCMKEKTDEVELEEQAWTRRQMSLYFKRPQL